MKTRSQKSKSRNRRGLTLIEMMVAVGVLALMILAFGQILTKSQQLVAAGEGTIRANAAAAPIAQIIRDDCRAITQDGFLCLAYDGRYRPRLYFTKAGTARSFFGATEGTGSLVTYGQMNNYADNSNSDNRILWRAAEVLADAGGTTYADVFTWKGSRYNMTDFRAYNRSDFADLLDGSGGLIHTITPDTLSVPADTLSEITNLWQVLSAYTASLDIAWTDGTVGDPNDASDKTLQWYNRTHPKDSGWGSKDPNSYTPGHPEYKDGTIPNYRALWTNDNPDDWPKAIKFTFTLKDPSMPGSFQPTYYEIICPVGN